MIEEHWRPSASLDVLRQRSELMATIRAFFNAREYWEVETPVLGRFGTSDVYLSNIKANFRGEAYCLQTSPEYHMKRLLAAGSGSIFQLARVFRDDELGRWHNPEFTLLEWYRLGVSHHVLMDEVDAFLQAILQSQPMIRKTYQDAFIEICGFDPMSATIAEMKACLAHFSLEGILPIDESDISQYLFLLMSHVVEPKLSLETAPVALYHFPVAQASLANIHNGVAERFEVFYHGVELANGFHELTDANAQHARFMQDNQIRQSQGLPVVPPDEYLLSALNHGLPSCSGVALGVDRLIAIALQKKSIANTLSFDFSRS